MRSKVGYLLHRAFSYVRPSRAISRVLCPEPLAQLRAAIIYLERQLPAVSSSLPGAQMERAAPCPCLALLLMGVTWPPLSPATPVVSYTTFSPLPGR